MDLVVDYAVLFVMNVCREKKEASPRVRLKIGFVLLVLQIRKACRGDAGVPRPSPRRDNTLTFLVRVRSSFSLFMHLHLHTHTQPSSHCFKAQMMPRSSENHLLAQGKLYLDRQMDDFDNNITTILCLRPGSQT